MWASCFNPHSSFRPSATREALEGLKALNPVSILTRAFARVQQAYAAAAWALAAYGFQSSLELSPECN